MISFVSGLHFFECSDGRNKRYTLRTNSIKVFTDCRSGTRRRPEGSDFELVDDDKFLIKKNAESLDLKT